MEELLGLLKDGRSRSIGQLAEELATTKEDVLRRIEFLERSGMIRRVLGNSCQGSSCSGCSGCGGTQGACSACLPEGGFKNMGQMWELCS